MVKCKLNLKKEKLNSGKKEEEKEEKDKNIIQKEEKEYIKK